MPDFNNQVIKSVMFIWPKIIFVYEIGLKTHLFSDVIEEGHFMRINKEIQKLDILVLFISTLL